MIQFDGHTATVCSLAFSPDSLTLASGARDGSLRLWDSAGGVIHDLPVRREGARNSLAWSPNSAFVATAHGSHLTVLRVGDVERLEREFNLFTGQIIAVNYLSNDILAVGTGALKAGEGGTLHLWDPVKHATRPAPTPVRGVYGIKAISTHPHTKRMHWIAGLANTTACVWRSWDITKPNATDVKLSKPANAISVSPDGGTVAIASDWILRVFSSDGKPRTDLTGHKGQVAGVGFIHGGRTVVSGSWDETVRFWDVATGQETARFPLKAGKVTALAVSPDGTRIAVGGTDGPIVVIDAE